MRLVVSHDNLLNMLIGIPVALEGAGAILELDVWPPAATIGRHRREEIELVLDDRVRRATLRTRCCDP